MKIGDFLTYLVFRAAFIPFRLGSLQWARRLGAGLGLFFYRVLPLRRKVVERNLRAFYGDTWNEKRFEQGVRDAYVGMGMAIGEFAWGENLTPANVEKYVKLEGLEHYEEAHRGGRPVILYGGHQAMWEWATVFPHLLRRPFHVVMKRIHNRYIDDRIKWRRSKFGVHAVNQRGALAVLEESRDRDLDIGMFVDQRAARAKGVWINVRGNPVSAMPGAAILALRHGLPALPIRVFRRPEGMVFRFYPPVTCEPTGDYEKDVQALTQAINDPITEWIGENPEAYFWLHDRFKIHADEQETADGFRRSVVTPQARV